MAEIILTKQGCRCTGCLQEYKLDFPMSIEKFTEVVGRITKEHLHCKKQMKMFDSAYLHETEFDFFQRLPTLCLWW